MREKGQDRFVRLAEARVERAIKHIRLIGNLADRSNYDYTEEQAAAIIDTLRREVADCRARFGTARRPKRSESFRLPVKRPR
jgi:hypothetical protein